MLPSIWWPTAPQRSVESVLSAVRPSERSSLATPECPSPAALSVPSGLADLCHTLIQMSTLSSQFSEAEDNADITLLDPPHVIKMPSLKLRMREAIYRPDHSSIMLGPFTCLKCLTGIMYASLVYAIAHAYV